MKSHHVNYLCVALAVALGFGAAPAEDAEGAARLRKHLNDQLQYGHDNLTEGRVDKARQVYRDLIDAGEAPFGFKSYAQLCLGQTYVDEKHWDKARAVFNVLAEDAQAPPHHREEARDRIAEVARLEKGLPAFDESASRTPLPEWPEPGMTLYVAPDGKRDNPGTEAAPLDTLAAARDAIRELKQLPDCGVVVSVAPGEYTVQEPFTLNNSDSGTADKPIIYRASKPGTALFTGGMTVPGFEPVVDSSILDRLPEESRGNLVQANLNALGIADYGTMQQTGHAIVDSSALLEFFFNGAAMDLARWPNEGYLKTGTVHDVGDAASNRGAVFDCKEERPKRWTQAKDPWIFGFPRYLWSDARLPIGAVDAEAGRMTLGEFYAYGGGVQADMPYYFYNLLEEIDRPGEYYLDRETGMLYFYPPDDLDTGVAEVSLLSKPFVALENVSHVAIEGLSFALGRTNGITITGGSNCLIAGCTLRKLGGTGITINGGNTHRVISCDLSVLGKGGVHIAGGNRATLERGDYLVENCHIHDFGRVKRTYSPAVWVDGVGTRIAHNEFHDAPCHAIRLNGNEHTVEFNDVHDVLLETDDQGGLDMWFDPTYRGNTIRYNYWHDMGREGLPCGAAGVRLDDAISETVVFGNVFARCAYSKFGGVQIHGGKENYIENNLFIDCAAAVSFSHWGPARWATFLDSERTIEALTKNVDIHEPPYSERYPSLKNLTDGPDINRIWRNIVYDCDTFLMRDNGQQEVMDNLITNQDPGFVDAAHNDYRLDPATAEQRPAGFRPIPFQAIGLYENRYRK